MTVFEEEIVTAMDLSRFFSLLLFAFRLLRVMLQPFSQFHVFAVFLLIFFFEIVSFVLFLVIVIL
jgi:hypothetical protein